MSIPAEAVPSCCYGDEFLLIIQVQKGIHAGRNTTSGFGVWKELEVIQVLKEKCLHAV